MECAQLIMTPANARAATAKSSQGSVNQVSHSNEIEVLEEYSITVGEPDVPATPIKPRAARQTGFEVIEDISLPVNSKPVAKPAPQSARKAKAVVDEEDDWFKSSKPASVATAPAPETEMEEAPAQIQSTPKVAPAARGGKNSGRVNGPMPSARLPKNKPLPEPVEEAPETHPVQVAEIVDENDGAMADEVDAPRAPAGKISRRDKPVRPSGRMAAMSPAAKKTSQRGPSADADEPACGPGTARNGRSSRRMEAAKSTRKSERDERDEKREKKRGSAQQGMSTGTMVGIGVGVAFLLLIGVALSSKSSDGESGKKKDALVDEGDKTPSSTYVRMAEERLAAGDKAKAGYYYSRAGDQAQKEGNQSLAQSYSMKAYDIKKFTTLNKAERGN